MKTGLNLNSIDWSSPNYVLVGTMRHSVGKKVLAANPGAQS